MTLATVIHFAFVLLEGLTGIKNEKESRLPT